MQNNISSIQSIIAEWQAKLLLTPIVRQHINKGVVLSISGCGTWIFKSHEVIPFSGSLKTGDCFISLATETLLLIYSNSLTPQEAYQIGKIKISGNRGVALYFSLLMLKN